MPKKASRKSTSKSPRRSSRSPSPARKKSAKKKTLPAPATAASPTEMSLDTSKMLALGLGLVALGAAGFRELPGMIADDAPGDKNINALYCATITLTTVGYGDICPASPDEVRRARRSSCLLPAGSARACLGLTRAATAHSLTVRRWARPS